MTRPARAQRAQPLVIAHRGASAERPENTLAAFDLAVQQSADMIETDLHPTRDGAIVLFHDSTLRAENGARIEIARATLAELRELHAPGATAGQRIPTLDEALDRFGAAIPFNLELKQSPRGPYPGLAAAALHAVKQRGLLQRTLFSSFYDAALAELRAHCAAARIALLIARRSNRNWRQRAAALDAEALHPESALANAALIEAAHGAGLAVHIFTVDAPAQMQRLLRRGADGLFTNHPARLRALLAPAAGGIIRPGG
ncbi:MAG: glycerophosphodiester phosphodiesterase [Deltaproteobacteria bacterium]|nr:glycerophosphodiester phosphodiesterase [Deltaproteobacteria bacterium]